MHYCGKMLWKSYVRRCLADAENIKTLQDIRVVRLFRDYLFQQILILRITKSNLVDVDRD